MPCLSGSSEKTLAGRDLRALVASEPRIEPDFVVSEVRRTTQKTRYVAARHHLLRADLDDRRIAASEKTALLDRFARHVAACDIVVLSDYAKGVLSKDVLEIAIAAARAAGKVIIADPKVPDALFYSGVPYITPNAGEASAIVGFAVRDDESAEIAAGRILASDAQLKGVLITRGADGMTYALRGEPVGHLRATGREVNDVSGAGDTVVAALALSMAAGADLPQAAQTANLAAGVAVAKMGTSRVQSDELVAAGQAARVQTSEMKIFSLPRLMEQVDLWRAASENVGFTNGCFDLLHPGHISLLASARAECNRLIVGLNSDASVKRLKGSSRPVQDEIARAIVLASLESVDAVVLFGEDTPLELIQAVRPDVLVKGADYSAEQVVGGSFVRAYGGRVVLAPVVPDQSTTRTIARLSLNNKTHQEA